MYRGALVFICMFALADPQEERGRAIFEEADRRDSGYEDVQVDLEMELRDRRGGTLLRLLSIKQLEVPDDGDKLLVVFESPKTVRGTALLSHAHISRPDDQWLFLPALERVKKIATRNKSGSFLGSEFAYEDLVAVQVDKYDYAYMRHEAPAELLGDPSMTGFNVVERRPRDELSGYTRQVVWIDDAEYRIAKIDFYDRRDRFLKTLSVSDYAHYEDSFWRPRVMEMLNHQSGRSTSLVWKNYRFKTGMTAERDFSTNSLRRAR